MVGDDAPTDDLKRAEQHAARSMRRWSYKTRA
jgi:hypothetical protein